jgi:hypothetical protein
MCSNMVVRGIYTSDNLYDFVTLPPEMRFKFTFEIHHWPEKFAWLELPADLRPDQRKAALDRFEQKKAKAALLSHSKNNGLSENQKRNM